MGRQKAQARRRGRPVSGRRWRVYVASGALALAVLAGAFAVAAFARSGGGDGASTASLIVPSPRSSDTPSQGHVYGRPDAPVTVLEYVDFQ